MFKRLLELLKITNTRSIVCSNPTVEHKTFTENGEFIKSAEFEMIWINKNVNDDYNAPDCLNEDEYLDYKLWEDMNTEIMYKKYLPNNILFIGKNPNIIFHGGCLGCRSQRLHGLERCKGCKYFRWKSGSQDLKINGEESAKMNADELRKLIGGY